MSLLKGGKVKPDYQEICGFYLINELNEEIIYRYSPTLLCEKFHEKTGLHVR